MFVLWMRQVCASCICVCVYLCWRLAGVCEACVCLDYVCVLDEVGVCEVYVYVYPC